MITFFLTFNTSNIPAQVEQIWFKDFNINQCGGVGSSDKMTGIAIDKSENIFILGNGYCENPTRNDISLIKYNSQGDSEWSRIYNGSADSADVGNDIKIDAQGNIYVIGTVNDIGSNGDIIIIKYSSSGDIIWTVKYNGPNNGFDMANALVIDNQENIYVTGGSKGNQTQDFITLKYNSSGNFLWEKRNISSFSSQGNEIKLDNAGNLWVIGIYDNVHTAFKYDKNGNLILTTQNLASSIKFDNSDNVYSTGRIVITFPYSDILTRKCDSTGNIIWTKTYAGKYDNSDGGTSLQVDTLGNVHTTGYIRDVNDKTHIVVLKYNTSGQLQWTRPYDDPEVFESFSPLGCSLLDNSDNLYITGYIGVNSIAGNMFLTVKYNSQGMKMWEARYRQQPFSNNHTVRANGLVLNNSNDVYVSGDGSTNSGNNIITVKYNQSQQFPNPPSFLGLQVQSSSIIKLTWTDNSVAETGFKIHRKNLLDTNWVFVASTPPNNIYTPIIHNYIDSGLTASTVYFYRVCSYNNNGNSSFSNVAFDTTYLAAPENLTAVAISESKINLNWIDNSINELGFKLERKRGTGGEFLEIDILPPNQTAYTDSSLDANTVYWYRIRAYNFSGNSDYSNIADDTTFLPVIIVQNEESIPSEYMLHQNFPNPFNPVTKISFDLPEKSFVTVKIYDISGRKILDILNKSLDPGKYYFTFHASELSSGIYFYELAANDFVSIKKMILIK